MLLIYLLGRANRPFKFDKSGQLFICTQNKTLIPVAVSVSNEDRNPKGSQGSSGLQFQGMTP
jgi:hypothetical protein